MIHHFVVEQVKDAHSVRSVCKEEEQLAVSALGAERRPNPSGSRGSLQVDLPGLMGLKLMSMGSVVLVLTCTMAEVGNTRMCVHDVSCGVLSCVCMLSVVLRPNTEPVDTESAGAKGDRRSVWKKICFSERRKKEREKKEKRKQRKKTEGDGEEEEGEEEVERKEEKKTKKRKSKRKRKRNKRKTGRVRVGRGRREDKRKRKRNRNKRKKTKNRRQKEEKVGGRQKRGGRS